MNQSIKKSYTQTNQQKRRFNKRLVVMTISILIIIATFIYTMNHPYTQITQVTVTGQKTLQKDRITARVHDFFTNKTLGVIPKSNIVFLRTETVEEILRAEFPKIKDLKVHIVDGDMLMVELGERRAHSLWCVEKEYEVVFDEECYFADNHGLLYARSPYFSGNVYLKIYMHPDQGELRVGQTVLTDSESFDDFFTFLGYLNNDYDLRVHRVLFQDFDDVIIELARVKNHTYYKKYPVLIYNQSDNYETILRNIGITLDYDSFKKDFAYQSDRLESIDVRFDGRVFYTFTPTFNDSLDSGINYVIPKEGSE